MAKPPAPPTTKSFDFKLTEYAPGHHPRFAAFCILPWARMVAVGQTQQEAIDALKAQIDNMPYVNSVIVNVSW